MNPKFENTFATMGFKSLLTVPPDYSWDEGSPLVEYPSNKLVFNDPSLVLSSTNNCEGIEYVAYSPFAVLTLSSTMRIDLSAVSVKRVMNFGDYYNSESNIVVSSSTSAENFCHTYVMPGLYSVSLEFTEFIQSTPHDFSVYSCIERYCREWTWKSTYCTPTVLTEVTWLSTLSGGPLEKRWKDRYDEECKETWMYTGGLYVQPIELIPPHPLFWQWYNFSCFPNDNLRNRDITWQGASFQQSDELIWRDVGSPCLNLPYRENSWVWMHQTCSSLLTSGALTPSSMWNEMECDSSNRRTWDEAQKNCFEYPYTLYKVAKKYVKEHLLRVIEIPPVAYLHVDQSKNFHNRISPYQVRLSPRFIKCGSFPIEKIVWDLGDGSPLLVQKRWDVNKSSQFIYTGTYDLDWEDPRNFDVIHTYTVTPRTGYSFYPSLTCYASSTYTSDCATGIVGPLKLKALQETDDDSVENVFNLRLIQNEITESGKLLLGEIGRTAVIWRYGTKNEEPTINPITIRAHYKPGSVNIRYNITLNEPSDVDLLIQFTNVLYTTTSPLSVDVILPVDSNSTTAETSRTLFESYSFLDQQSEFFNIKVIPLQPSKYIHQTEFVPTFEPQPSSTPQPTPLPTPTPIPNCDLVVSIKDISCDLSYTVTITP